MTDKLMLRVGGRDHLIEIRRAYVDVTSVGPVPDKHWTYTDLAGHEHAYDPANHYPSLGSVLSEPYPCPYGPYDCCGDMHISTHLECLHCGERIDPGTTTAPSRTVMNGRVEFILNGEPSTEEECRALLEAFKREGPS